MFQTNILFIRTPYFSVAMPTQIDGSVKQNDTEIPLSCNGNKAGNEEENNIDLKPLEDVINTEGDGEKRKKKKRKKKKKAGLR